MYPCPVNYKIHFTADYIECDMTLAQTRQRVIPPAWSTTDDNRGRSFTFDLPFQKGKDIAG